MAVGIEVLPVELLLPIFEYASLDDRPTSQPSASNGLDWTIPTRRDPSTSTNISQVCGRWRQLSLSHQFLWRYLPRLVQDLTSLHHLRCRSATLDVEIRPEHLHAGMRHNDVQILHDLVPRAVSLFISCKPGLDMLGSASALVSSRSHPGIRSFLRILKALNAPPIEDLRMDLQWEENVANIFVEVPRKMFRGQALEKLHSAQFNYVLLHNPQTFVWPALRRADFTNSQAWDSATTFVAFFQGVPLLEDFKFTRHYGGIGRGLPALDTTSVHGLPPLRSVPMANLKSFVLHGPYYDVFFSLALLGLPCTTLLSLTITGRWLPEYAKEKLQIMHDALAVHFAQATQTDAHFDSVTFKGRTMSAAHHPSGHESVSSALLPPSFTISIIPEDSLTDDEDREALNMLAFNPVFTRTPNLILISPEPHDPPHNQVFDCLEIREIRRIFDLYTSYEFLSLSGTLLCSLFCHSILYMTRPQSLKTLRLVGAEFTCRWEDRKGHVLVDMLFNGTRTLRENFECIVLDQCTVGARELRELRDELGESGVVLIDSGPSRPGYGKVGRAREIV